MEANVPAFEIYSRVRNQVLPDSEVLNVLAIECVCKLYGVTDILEMVDRLNELHYAIKG